MTCPSSASSLPPDNERAQGMPGAGRTHGPPATKKAGGSYHRSSRNIRHSLRDGFTAYTCAPRSPGLLASVPPGFDPGVGPSVGGPGLHDFAVRQDDLVHATSALNIPPSTASL